MKIQCGKTTTNNYDTSIKSQFPITFTSATSWTGASMNIKNRASNAAVKIFPAEDGAHFYAISPGYSAEIASWIAIGY